MTGMIQPRFVLKDTPSIACLSQALSITWSTVESVEQRQLPIAEIVAHPLRVFIMTHGSRPGNLSWFTPPSFCHDCGKPYPWTEAKLKAARELTDLLENLSPEERDILKKTFDDIIRDTPQTAVAATKFKRIAAKVGKVAAEQLRQLIVDIASETAKKIILEQGK